MNLFKKIFLLLAILFLAGKASAQQSDSLTLRKIYSEILVNGKAYDWLHELTKTVGERLSGSNQAEQAVKLMEKKLKEAGADSVWLQDVKVPHWVRGEKEKATIIRSNGKKEDVPICALGMSIATPSNGITAQII